MTSAVVVAWLSVMLAGAANAAQAPRTAADAVVGGSCTESDLINALAAGGLVTFACGGPKSIPISTVKVISKDTMLDGGDAITLSGGFGTRLFVVNPGVNFQLKHLILDEAASTGGDGGAIANHGALTLDHTTIQHSQTDSAHSGGAIFSDGPVTLTSSLLIGNTGGSAGALFANFGNAIVHISNSTFSGNQTVNTATGFGGAIWVGQGAQVSISGGSVTSNTAQFGGGVYITQGGAFTVTSSGPPAQISGNTATYAGGGVYNSLASAALTNVRLQGNSALNPDSHMVTFGGGIDQFRGTTTLLAASLISNTADSGGGLFVISGTLSVTNTLLAGNTASAGDGGGLEAAGNGFVTVDQAVFQHNHATNGGGIGNSAEVVLQDSSFISNTAAQDGGGIYSSGSVPSTNVLFSDNAAANGGGLALVNTAEIDTSLTFVGNYASAAGGGAYIASTAFIIYYLTVINNHVGNSGRGGGLHMEDSAVTVLDRTVISDNRVDGNGQGGGGDLEQSHLETHNLQLSGNQVGGGSGGGLRTLNSSVNIYGATIRDNFADNGGALYNDTSSTTIVSGTLSDNIARYGGGAILLHTGTLELVADSLSGNHSDPASAVGAADSAAANALAIGVGGAVLISSGVLTATNTTFSGNSAAQRGGALFNAAGAASLSNVTLSGNSALLGGGVYNNSARLTETITLSNTLIAAGAQGANCTTAGTIVSKGYNLSSDNTCAAFFNQTGDLNNVNPQLGTLTHNGGPTPTQLPATGSPGINAIPLGANGCGTLLTTDQRGAPRPIPNGGHCDIGAVEAGAVLPLLFLPLVLR